MRAVSLECSYVLQNCATPRHGTTHGACAKQVNGVKFQTETLPFHSIDCRCRGDVVARPQVSSGLGEPVEFDQFAPCVALGEASAHGASLSLRGDGRKPAPLWRAPGDCPCRGLGRAALSNLRECSHREGIL